MAEDLSIEIGVSAGKAHRALAKFENETVRTAQRAEKSFKSANRQFQAANKSANAFAGNGLRNASLQLSQVAQQGAATGNYIQALAIQLPDLALGFGTVGIAAGVVAGALLPVITNMIRGTDVAAELEGSVKALEKAMSELESAQASLDTPLADLAEKYGGAVFRAKELLAVQRDIAAAAAKKELSSTAGAIAGTAFGGVAGQTADEIKLAADLYQNAQIALNAKLNEAATASGYELQRLNNEILALDERMNALRPSVGAILEIAESFGISAVEAGDLVAALAEIDAQDTPRKQAEALREVSERLRELTGGFEDMGDEGTQAAFEIYQRLLDAESAALQLAAVDVASGLWEGAEAAGQLATNLQAVAAAHAQNAATRSDPLAQTTPQERMAAAYQQYGQSRIAGQRLDQINAAEEARRTSGSSSRKSSGGGGGSARVDPMLAEAERLYDATRTAAENYATELERLQVLLDGGYITQDTYNRALEMTADKYGEVAAAGEQFEELNNMLKDSILDFAENGVDAMDGLAKAIKRAAIEALLFNQGPLAALLGGGAGSKGLLGGLLSFDGGGFTGGGVRAGGIDGKGGFPAILHPNETIIDHSKGGGGGGGSMTIFVRPSADLIAEARSAGEQRSIQVVQENNRKVVPRIANRQRTDPRRVG